MEVKNVSSCSTGVGIAYRRFATEFYLRMFYSIFSKLFQYNIRSKISKVYLREGDIEELINCNDKDKGDLTRDNENDQITKL